MKKRDVEGPQPPPRGALACSRSEDNVPYGCVRRRQAFDCNEKRDVEGAVPYGHVDNNSCKFPCKCYEIENIMN